jgi:hypothetical protein
MTITPWTDSVDHRDPIWEEGRDYQLICGLEERPNLRLCSVSENSKKSNRFVPWRVDSRVPSPEEPGDWAWFLNLDTEEWEFIQWQGRRWWEITRKTCGEYFAGKNSKGKTYNRDPKCPSNFIDYHRRRQEDPKLNETFLEQCRENGRKSQGGRKNKGKKFSSEVNATKASHGEKNGMFGKVRITNGQYNTQIPKGNPIPEGYRLGMTRFNKQAK